MDIAWAKVTTLGSSVVDVFCIVVPSLVTGDGPSGRRRRPAQDLERDLYAVLPAPRPAKPVSRPAELADR